MVSTITHRASAQPSATVTMEPDESKMKHHWMSSGDWALHK
jgi:hypothetical protein